MKQYIDFTTEELDNLYAKLSEVAQDFVYSDIIKEEVSIIGKEIGLPIDKWEILNNLIIETILGIVSAAAFQKEVSSRLNIDAAQTQMIVDHMDTEIFSVIRDESIGEYEEDKSKNSNIAGVGAIYDESMSGIITDPYREDIGSMSHGPLITEDKLHLVDELFAPYHPKVRELTPADGSVRVQPADSPYIPHLFGGGADMIEKSPVIITKATLLAAENANKPTQTTVEIKDAAPTHTPAQTQTHTEVQEQVLPITEKHTELPENNPVHDKIQITVKKSTTPGMIQLIVSKAQPSVGEVSGAEKEPQSAIQTSPTTVVYAQQPKPATKAPTVYSVDPYKEPI
ncbi:MAG: hypothetical protein RI996_167 [Candidatus Parcubacteria bacterium]|jgi:hypothetical protein